MPTLYLPKERQEWFRDHQGVWTTSQHKDETKSYSFDYTDILDSGETVSASSFTTSGVTASGAALATPIASVNIAGTDGWIENTLTTSASRTLVYIYRFIGTATGGESQDYVA